MTLTAQDSILPARDFFYVNLFATMILLASLVHTTLDWIDAPYLAVRAALPSRRIVYEHTRASTQYIPFDDWNHPMQFMFDGLKARPPNTG